MTSTHEQPELTEAAFVDIYKDTDIVLAESTRTISLQAALAMEDNFCPADKKIRQDPEKRLQKLAKMVGANLLPEHRYLIPEED